MAAPNPQNSSTPNIETQHWDYEQREKTPEGISLQEAANVMGTPEAILLTENLETNEEGYTLLRVSLISMINKLLRQEASLRASAISPENLPSLIREKQAKISLSKEEIIALSRLETTPALLEKLKGDWGEIQSQISEGAKAAQEADPFYKRWPKKIVETFKNDPVKATVYTALGAAGLYAGWKLFKWAFSKKEEGKKEETKISTKGKWILGGIALATVGALIGPKKLMEWFPSLSGLQAGWEKTKAIMTAIAGKEFKKAYDIWTSDEDPKEDLHNAHTEFIKEKTAKKIDPKIFRIFGPMSYTKFKEEVSGNQWTEVLKQGKEAIGKLIEKGVSITAILGMSDAEARIQATELVRFFETDINASEAFEGKTVDEVMELIKKEPEKYLKSKNAPQAAEKQTPETLGGALEIAYQNTTEDFSKLISDLKGVITGLEGSEEVLSEYQNKVNQLRESEGFWTESQIQWEKVELTRKLLKLMWDNNWTLAMEGGAIVLWNGTKSITHHSFNSLWEPIWYTLRKSPETGLNSYVANVGPIMVFAGSAGVIHGALKGGLMGALKGAVSGVKIGAITPIYLGKKMFKDVPFYAGHLEEYSKLIQGKIELAKKYALKTWGVQKLKLDKGVTKDLKYLALQEEYNLELRNAVEKELEFYKKAQRIDVGFIDAKNKTKVDELTEKKAKLNDRLEGKYKYSAASRLKFHESLKPYPEAQKIFQESGEKLDAMAYQIENYPKGKWSEFLLKNPKAIKLIAENPELYESLSRYSFMAAFEESAVRSKVERLFASAASPEELKKGLHEIATQHKILEAKKGEIKVEKALETDPKLLEIHNKTSKEILTLQEKGFALQKQIQEGLAQNPKLNLEQFFATPEGLKIKQELDAINTGIEKATQDYTKAIARELSEGKLDNIEQLEKPLKKRALQFIANVAGKEVPISHRLAAKMISNVGNKVLILAPIIAIKAYAHGSREGIGGEIGSAAVSMTPVLGTLADFYSAATGEDYISKAKVGRLESLGWAITGAACDVGMLFMGAGAGARLVLKGARATGKIAETARAIEGTAEAIKAGSKIKKIATAGAIGTGAMMTWTAGSATYEWITTPKETAAVSMEGIELETSRN